MVKDWMSPTPKIRNHTKIMFSLLLFHISLEVLAIAVRKKKKRHFDWKERNKIILIFRWHNCLVKLLVLISEFRRLQDKRLTYKNKSYFYTSSEQLETDLLPSPTSVILRYCLNLTKHVQDLYAENCKTLMKETKDLNKWKDLPCLWIERLTL